MELSLIVAVLLLTKAGNIAMFTKMRYSVMTTPPSFSGVSQSRLTATLSVEVGFRVKFKFIGEEGGAVKKSYVHAPF